MVLLVGCASSACGSNVLGTRGPALPGVIEERELQAGVHVADLAIGPLGDVWLATLNYGNGPSGIVQVRARGEMRTFSRPESFGGVAVDPADIAWLTAGVGASHEQPKLVRIDSRGHTREYLLPVEGNFEGITIGPDRAPWFVDAAGSEIGRLGSDGKIIYYGPASADPTHIIADHDGNLWFSETTGNRIGRLKLDGTIDEFSIPTSESRPAGLASSADGNIWFCESAADKIGRISRDGHITELRVPTKDAWPIAITAGRDGIMWFTELEASKIGRVSRAGAITEYDVPGGGYPDPIAASADGTIWVASNAKRDSVLGLTTSRSRLVHFRP